MTRRLRKRKPRTRVAARWPVALLVAVLLSGCGVRPQSAPEPVPSDRLPSATQSPAASGAVRGQVWGARNQRLVPVFVELTDSGVAGRVRALLSLAEPGQRPPTALRDGTRLLRVTRSGDTVELALSSDLHLIPMTDLPLALGQLVFTVTELPGVRRVHVRAGQQQVRYLDATGRRITRPLVRTDFDGLVEQQTDP
jgi:hypothetical protein